MQTEATSADTRMVAIVSRCAIQFIVEFLLTAVPGWLLTHDDIRGADGRGKTDYGRHSDGGTGETDRHGHRGAVRSWGRSRAHRNLDSSLRERRWLGSRDKREHGAAVESWIRRRIACSLVGQLLHGHSAIEDDRAFNRSDNDHRDTQHREDHLDVRLPPVRASQTKVRRP